MSKLYKVMDGLDFCIRVLIFIAVAVMTYSTFVQVLGRYILVVPFAWTEELSRRMMTWLLFLASPLGYRRGVMVGVDILTRKLSEKTKKILDIIVCVLVIGFGGFMIWQGYFFADRMRMQQSAALGISMYYVYIVIPISGFLFVLFSIESMIKQITGYKKPEQDKGETEA